MAQTAARQGPRQPCSVASARARRRPSRTCRVERCRRRFLFGEFRIGAEPPRVRAAAIERGRSSSLAPCWERGLVNLALSPPRARKQKTRRLLTNRPCLGFVYEESHSK